MLPDVLDDRGRYLEHLEEEVARLRAEVDETKMLLYKKLGLVRGPGPVMEEEIDLQRLVGGVRPFSDVERKIKMKIHQRMKERKEKEKTQ